MATIRVTPKTSVRHLTLPPADMAALEELAVLTAYSDGFTHTLEMERLCMNIAERISPAGRRAYLARAERRERLPLVPAA